MSLRIAHFVQRYPPALGGSESYFQRLSRHFSNLGHHVEVWTTNALDLEAFWSRSGQITEPGESDDNGVRVRRFACRRWPLRRYLLKALSFLPGDTWKAMMMPCNPITFEMRRESAKSENRFDIVHATAFPYAWPIVCARRLAQRCNAKFFITPFLHLGIPDDRNDRTRRAYLAKPLLALLRSADGVFVQTPSERSAVIECGIDPKRVILQGMGVDPTECTGGNRERFRMRYGFDSNTVVVGHLANLSFEKGTIDLLQAAEVPWNLGATFRAVLAGPAMNNFRRFWSRYEFLDRATNLGILNDEQKRDFFAGIDLFALPSRSDSFGLVLLEAWANGIPVIAYRCGGPADLVRDGKDGLLVGCDNQSMYANKLSDALTLLVGDSALRKRLGAAGQTRTRDEFRWEAKLRIVQEVYNSAVK